MQHLPSDVSVDYINGILAEMSQIKSNPGAETEQTRKKGALGEKAAAAALRRYIAVNGGRLFHSVTFSYAEQSPGVEHPGNLNYKDGKLFETGYSLEEMLLVASVDEGFLQPLACANQHCLQNNGLVGILFSV